MEELVEVPKQVLLGILEDAEYNMLKVHGPYCDQAKFGLAMIHQLRRLANGEDE